MPLTVHYLLFLFIRTFTPNKSWNASSYHFAFFTTIKYFHSLWADVSANLNGLNRLAKIYLCLSPKCYAITRFFHNSWLLFWISMIHQARSANIRFRFFLLIFMWFVEWDIVNKKKINYNMKRMPARQKCNDKNVLILNEMVPLLRACFAICQYFIFKYFTKLKKKTCFTAH